MTDSPNLHQMMEVLTNFLIYSINNKLALTKRTTFIAFEPTGQLISVKHNFSILGNYFFNFLNRIEYVNNQDGLATSSEWKSLSDSIEYKGLKTILAELLYTRLCFDNKSCNNFNSDFRPTH